MGKKQVVVKSYKGKQQQATKKFNNDLEKMKAQGYFPSSQTWEPGSYGGGDFLVALILCFLLIGILIFIYMIIIKPAGSLTVTYNLQELTSGTTQTVSAGEKSCPKCAESIKSAAIVCRYCGHTFE